MVGKYCGSHQVARILWQEYDGGYLEYQYPGEEKQRIYGQGLTYTTEQLPGQCSGIPYRLAGTFTRYNNQTRTWRVGDVCRNDVYGPIGNLVNVPTNDFTNGNNWQIECHDGVGNPHTVPIFAWYGYCAGIASENKFGTTPKITLIAPLDSNVEDNCGDCTFTVRRDGTVIYQETREVCPTVNQVDCELQDYKNGISVTLKPFTEQIEITNFAYLGNASAEIPDYCLNIYKVSPYSNTDNPELPSTASLVQQICSVEGCPPPEVEVFCLGEEEKCPPGTCEVTCNGHTCCYDPNTGKSVKSF